MSGETKVTIAVIATILGLACIIAGSSTYYYLHRPPVILCQDACGYPGMVRSFDPQGGCVCRE